LADEIDLGLFIAAILDII